MMRSLDEDFAYEQLRQKRIDNMKTNEEYRLLEQQLAAKDAEIEEMDHLRERMSKILALTAIALKGPNEELSRHSWHDLPEKAEELQKQLALRDKQLLKNADILGEAADALDHKDKQIVELLEALEKIRKEQVIYTTTYQIAEKVLAATADLSNYILCDAEPVAWMFIDDEEYGYHQFNRTPPTKEQVEYLAQHNRPAWNPIYKARKQP